MKDGTKDQIPLIDIHDVLTKEGDARGARVRARALTVNRVRLSRNQRGGTRARMKLKRKR